MNSVKFLYLSQADVIKAGLTLGGAVPLIEESFRAHGCGEFENPPKPGIHPLPDAFIHAMPGYLPGQGVAGVKWISSFSSNHHHQVPTVMGLIVLNDVDTGAPRAVMEGGWITAVRTAAVSAVAAKNLARADAGVIGLVGAGVQGYVHTLAMREVLPRLDMLKVFDVNREQVDRYLTKMAPHASFRLERADSAQAAIETADVIITATGRLNRPIFHKEWIREGALVLPVHTRGWDKDIPYKMDKFVVDYWEQFSRVQGQPGAYYESLLDPDAQLGEIVAGKKPGRESERERIISHNYGMAIHDMAIAREIFTRATAKGLGTVLPLMEETPIFV